MGFELPLCILPFEIQEDYRRRVKRFFERGYREEIERLKEEVELRESFEIRLSWDNDKGLKNISLPPHRGLDFNGRRYVFHNVFNENSKEGQALFQIAKKYVSLLDDL